MISLNVSTTLQGQAISAGDECKR